MRTSRLKDLLEVILVRSGAPLEIVFSCHHALFIGVLDLLIVVVGHRSKEARTALLPLPPALSTLFGSFDGDTGGCRPATASSRTCVNQSKGSPNSLLT
jgi:hypothetical protein